MNKLVVFQSDFGLKDGAVAAMVGVCSEVDSSLKIHHLTHDITPFHLWEASYRLYQAAEYWPKHTTFVSVVDPGVGSKRKSVVAKTKLGHYFVTPDNGTLTHLKKFIGIEEVREINEKVLRRKNSENSHTFHGRDIYAFTAAKLGSGSVSFEDVGPKVNVEEIVELEVGSVESFDGGIKGTIDILDIRFGSLWTNIFHEDFFKIGFVYGEKVSVTIKNCQKEVYKDEIVFGKSFAEVKVNEPIVYINSLLRVAIAINQGNFANTYDIGTGIDWNIELKKI